MNEDEKISDIKRKIDREKALIQAAQLMRQKTNNEAVQSKLETQIRDGGRNIEFFQQRLDELLARRSVGRGMENLSLGPSGTPGGRPKSAGTFNDQGGPPQPPPKDASSSSFYGDRTSIGGSTLYSQPGDLMPSRGPFPGQPPDSTIPKARPNFSKLGMLIDSWSYFVLYRNTDILARARPYQI
jgi:classical protein kinase C